jgi:hypothetical protein
VYREFGQVGDAAESLVRSRDLAGRQSPERVEVDRVGALGGEVSIQKHFMAQFIFGVIRDVLVHVAVQLLHAVGVVGVAPGGRRRIARNQLAGELRHFSVLDPRQFVVLQPDVALDDFRSRDEAENGSIALAE